MNRQTHTIDATGRPLGRLAVEIALLLRGKNRPEYVPYKDDGDYVVVKNITKIKFSGKKLSQKKYYHHSGYLGSLKATPLKTLFEKNPPEVLRRAVLGMLTKNKLKAQQIKRLKFE